MTELGIIEREGRGVCPYRGKRFETRPYGPEDMKICGGDDS